jgi:hypothetical protein
MSLLRNVVAAGLYLSLTPALVQAQVSPPGAHPPQAGWAVSARYRFEGVDSDAFQREAEAHTVSVRAGYSFRFADGWSALLEGEGVAELNDHFNSGAFPAVPDGRAVEINQAWVDWQRPSVGTRVGRQRIALDNARFIGDVAWRQNMQTFDAAQLRWQPLAGWDLQAYLVDRVHRVAGDNARDRLARERDLDARLLRVSRTLGSSLLVLKTRTCRKLHRVRLGCAGRAHGPSAIPGSWGSASKAQRSARGPMRAEAAAPIGSSNPG